MKMPTTQYEKKLFRQGYFFVAGADEAGRGAWAGPIVAAAVILSPYSLPLARGRQTIRDSKTLSSSQREGAYEYIVSQFDCAVGVIEPSELDRHGLTRANQQAILNAVLGLETRPDYVVCDGRGFHFTSFPYQNVVDGDAKIFCVAAASIVAKVVRDRIMGSYDTLFARHGFGQHKGYGTAMHQRMIKRHGLTALHRRSFAPVRLHVEHS